MNTVWSFARLDYSPDPDRELWAIAPSRPAARWTPPVRDGGSWGWEGQEGHAAADASAVVREEERWLTTQEQRARAQERAVQNLAERVAAQRARREAYNRLLSYAREAVTTALARTPAARKDEKAERPVRVRYCMHSRLGTVLAACGGGRERWGRGCTRPSNCACHIAP